MVISPKNIKYIMSDIGPHKICLFSIIVLGLIYPVLAHADETTQVEITLLSEPIMNFDSSDRLLRANIGITNYDPQDGYYFMKITNLETEEIVKDFEIMPKYKGDDVWGVQIAHLIPSQIEKEEIIGDYQIEIYSEYGLAKATTVFSVIDSDKPNELSLEQSGEVENLIAESNELENETPLATQPESTLPSWVKDIFIWYAAGTLSENELLNAIEFLANEGIININ